MILKKGAWLVALYDDFVEIILANLGPVLISYLFLPGFSSTRVFWQSRLDRTAAAAAGATSDGRRLISFIKPIQFTALSHSSN